MENFGKFMAILLIMTISPIINGFVFNKLWLWFIVPTFEVTPLRLIEAIGIILFINYLKLKPYKDVKENNIEFWEELGISTVYLIMMAAFVLGIGKLVTLFM